MASSSLNFDDWSYTLPGVDLEVRHGSAHGATYALDGVDFLIGTVPGCDLRVVASLTPGPSARASAAPRTTGENAAVLCLIARHPGGATLRRLAPTHPVLVNGKNVAQAELVDGDRVQVGLVEIQIRITPAQSAAAHSPDLEHERQEFQESVRQFRQKLLSFQHDKEEFERAKQQRPQTVLADSETQRALLQTDLLEERALEIERQKNEVAKARQEIAELRRQIQDRRDKAWQSDDAETARYDFAERMPRGRQRHVETGDVTQSALRLDEERRLFKETQKDALAELARKQADLQAREATLAENTRALEARIKQFEVDVLKLHHREVGLAERETGQQKQEDALTRRSEQLRRDTADFEAQVVEIDQWRVQLTEEADRFAKEKKAQEALIRQTAEREAAFEGQQATVTTLRGRLERMREDLRVREQKLDQERDALATRELNLITKEQAFDKLQLDMETDRQQYDQDRQQWLERAATMEAAVRQLKLAQDSLLSRDQRLKSDTQELAERAQQFEEAEGVLHSRLAQLAETQERLDIDRKAHQERSINLLEREQACITLQEQLQRRSQEIAGRHKEIADRIQEHQAKIAEVEALRKGMEDREQEFKTQADTWRAELDRRAECLQKQHAEVVGFDDKYKDQLAYIAAERKAHGEERAQFHREQQASLEKVVQTRLDLEKTHADALALLEQLPDAELRAGTAVDRMGYAREQLREHLGEIHEYVRQCQDELTQLRSRLQTDLAKLDEQEKLLRQNQDEHRLAVVAFRQELIDWQGQIGELRRLLSRDETRLERKQAKVEERARAMDEASQRLAEHAEELQEQERDVAERRNEVDRHLGDMQAWYRDKLRDLAGVPLVSNAFPPSPSGRGAGGEGRTDRELASSPDDTDPGIIPTNRSILSITASADPGDQKLGQVLRDLQLIDADTLTALLAEARRQRRSLRQVLLASGVITLYQLALIEAGNVGGLALGPVRIIDRIRHTALETVYRVFDPRRGVEAVLRHLSEANMTDPVRPDEFRDLFTQAKLNDPHLANTLEVLELSGRPAVLQEWLTGLPAQDWPALAAAPGVCYRLLTQAAQGLATTHHAGIIHGHLNDAHLLLTADGVLKICGIGEPPWLAGVLGDETPTERDDLRALGKIASSWCTPSGVRKGPKTKPLPEALVSILYRLTADGTTGYGNVDELLDELHKASAAIPANTEAWDRLLKYVREHGAAEATLRQSA